MHERTQNVVDVSCNPQTISTKTTHDELFMLQLNMYKEMSARLSHLPPNIVFLIHC